MIELSVSAHGDGDKFGRGEQTNVQNNAGGDEYKARDRSFTGDSLQIETDEEVDAGSSEEKHRIKPGQASKEKDVCYQQDGEASVFPAITGPIESDRYGGKGEVCRAEGRHGCCSIQKSQIGGRKRVSKRSFSLLGASLPIGSDKTLGEGKGHFSGRFRLPFSKHIVT